MNLNRNTLVPVVIESTSKGERSFDIYSRMLRERIIFFHEEVNDATASVLIAQLLLLESEDPSKPITLYINSPGGSVSAGFAIFDTMEAIKCPVHTIGMGTCASMGAFLLAAGEPGYRKVLPNAKVMIHQVLGGAQGQETEVKIAYEEMKKTKQTLNKWLCLFTGQDYATIDKDTDRNNWKTAKEAVEYNLVDEVISTRARTIVDIKIPENLQ